MALDQDMVNTLFGALFTGAGWWLKALLDSVRDLQHADRLLTEKVAGIEVLVAGNYVTKSELEKLVGGLMKKLDRIEDKLDDKVSK